MRSKNSRAMGAFAQAAGFYHDTYYDNRTGELFVKQYIPSSHTLIRVRNLVSFVCKMSSGELRCNGSECPQDSSDSIVIAIQMF
jgi:hypothetical protein